MFAPDVREDALYTESLFLATFHYAVMSRKTTILFHSLHHNHSNQ